MKNNPQNQTNSKYIDKAELESELLKYRASSDIPSERKASERLGELLLLLHRHILHHGHFNRYDESIKDELMSYSLYRIIKHGLNSYNPEYGSSAFAYFTRAVFQNYYSRCMKLYERRNRHEEYVRDCLANLKDKGFYGVEDVLREFDFSVAARKEHERKLQKKRRQAKSRLENNKTDGA